MARPRVLDTAAALAAHCQGAAWNPEARRALAVQLSNELQEIYEELGPDVVLMSRPALESKLLAAARFGVDAAKPQYTEP